MESALNAVVTAIYPKNPEDPDFELCEGRWEWYGHIGEVILDNASYNVSPSLQAAIHEFGAVTKFTKPGEPQNKSNIEYFFHLLTEGFIVNQPGWSGPKQDREMIDRGLGSAIYTVADFKQRLVKWIVDEYSNKPRAPSGLTPREAWHKQFEDMPPLLPRHQPSKELIGTIPVKLTFRHSGGLLRLHLRYQSSELEVLRKRLGRSAKVIARYSPWNLEYLYVLDPSTKHYLKVPCIEDPRYVTGLTNYQHRLVCKKLRLMKLNPQSIANLQAAREALAAQTAKYKTSKKLIERRLSVQAGDLSASRFSCERESGNLSAANQISNFDSTVLVTELEDLMAKLEEDVPDDEFVMEVE